MMEEARKDKLKKEIQGIVLAVAGFILLLALISYHDGDLSLNTYSSAGEVQNLMGRFGAQSADLLLQVFGIAAYAIPLALLYLAYRALRFQDFRWRAYKVGAFIGLLVALSALFAMHYEFTEVFGRRLQTGGWTGFKTARLLRDFLGLAGAYLLLLAMLAVSVMVLSRFSFVLYADWWINTLGDTWARRREKRALERELRGE